MSNGINLEIRVRCVHILFADKELKVLLVPAGSDDYTLPVGLRPKAAKSLPNIHEMLSPLLGIAGQFIRQVNLIPALKLDGPNQYLAFEFYTLIKPEMSSLSSKGGKWFSFYDATQLNADLAAVIDQTLTKLREEINYQPIEYHLLPPLFTIPELQTLYELILDRKLDRGNFYRKMMSLNVLESQGLKRTGNAHKSPTLYAFNTNYFKKTKDGLFKIF